YDVTVAVVSPDLTWRFPTGLGPEELAAAAPVDVTTAIGRLGELAPDVAVPQLFCLPGMTTYRSLLDLLGIPFVGNPPDVMALAAHKARAKAVVAGAGVRVPAGQLLRPSDVASVPLPVVV